MIQGLHFSAEQIKDLERKTADEYSNSDDPRLSDALSYYSPLFREYLLRHASKGFLDKNPQEQEDILEEEDRRFVYSMTYSFMKGHMDCFQLILSDFTQKIKFEKEFFQVPSNKNDFLDKIFSAMPDELYQKKINHDRVYTLVQYTRDNFENGIYYIMYLAKIFYMKGVSIAYDQITTEVVQTQVKITGYSKILHVPYNQSFEVTPAFEATFDTEHLNTETWDISWDATHGMEAQNVLIGKLFFNRFTRQEVYAYADVDAITYQAIRDFFKTDSKDEDPRDVLYEAQFIFTLPSDLENYHAIQGVEYRQMMHSLRDTICKKLGIRGNQILLRV